MLSEKNQDFCLCSVYEETITHSYESSYWWFQLNRLIFIIKVTRSSITVETHIWLHLWGCIQKGLNQEGQFTLQVGGSMPCAGVLTWIKRGRKAYPRICLSVLHCQHSRASCLASLLIILPSHYGTHPQSQKRTKPCLCRLLLVRHLITATGKLMDTNAFVEEISLYP